MQPWNSFGISLKPLLHTVVFPFVIYKRHRFTMMLINDRVEMCVFFSEFQGAAGMLGSADLVKLCFLQIIKI